MNLSITIESILIPKGGDSDFLYFINSVPREDAFLMIDKWFMVDSHNIYITDSGSRFEGLTERWLWEWGIPYNQVSKEIGKYDLRVYPNDECLFILPGEETVKNFFEIDKILEERWKTS